uniref:Ricin B-type lectin domain-containing protein n=2 Tax=Caenorhabditis tropicalis TaxID=1561998 RepID=A0A1I7U6T5_9PELO
MSLAVLSENYKSGFLENVQKNQSGFNLRNQNGMLNDSFEISVQPKCDHSVDINMLIMYKKADSNDRWILETSEHGQKLKSSYPKYDPWCSADLVGHLFWVPCTPKKAVEAEYGKQWYLDQSTSKNSLITRGIANRTKNQ